MPEETIDNWGEEEDKGVKKYDWEKEKSYDGGQWTPEEDLNKEDCERFEKSLEEHLRNGGEPGDLIVTREGLGDPPKNRRYIRTVWLGK